MTSSCTSLLLLDNNVVASVFLRNLCFFGRRYCDDHSRTELLAHLHKHAACTSSRRLDKNRLPLFDLVGILNDCPCCQALEHERSAASCFIDTNGGKNMALSAGAETYSAVVPCVKTATRWPIWKPYDAGTLEPILTMIPAPSRPTFQR